MTYAAPVQDMRFVMRELAGLDARRGAAGLRRVRRPTWSTPSSRRRASSPRGVLAPLNAVGDRAGRALDRTARSPPPPGWKRRLPTSSSTAAGTSLGVRARASAGRACRTLVSTRGRSRCGTSANIVVLAVPDADARRDRGARACAARTAQKRDLPAEAGRRRMDRHDEPDRAAGRLRPRRGAHPRGAAGRRQLPHHRPEDLHHLRRARPDRQHRAPRARAPARRAGRRQGHLALRRAEVPGQRRRHARRAQRRALRLDRAQARHPREPDLRAGLRRQRRRDRLPRRRARTTGSSTCSS